MRPEDILTVLRRPTITVEALPVRRGIALLLKAPPLLQLVFSSNLHIRGGTVAKISFIPLNIFELSQETLTSLQITTVIAKILVLHAALDY